MRDGFTTWERRIVRLVVGLQWFSLVMGVFVGVFQGRASTSSLVAASLATIFVIVTTAIPPRLIRAAFLRDAAILAGAFLTMSAVALSGGSESPYLLLSLTPTIYATFFGGLRLGLATASLSSAMLVALVLAEGRSEVPSTLLWVGLYVMVGLTFAQARRVLVETQRQAEELAVATAEAGQRLERLQRAHDLLTRLSEITHSSEINPISVGSTALDHLVTRFPGSAAVAALTGDGGPVVVARHGRESAEVHRSSFPLVVGNREVGLVVLANPTPLGADEKVEVEEFLRPLALAFANILLLQGIARTAIREERARLARELHDEIGPSLASLGLALDLTLLQHPTETAIASHLQELRGNVSKLVEEVRSSVADLREPRHDTLTAGLVDAVNALHGGPEVIVDISERRPPRPSIVQDVLAITTEAIRNAHRHSNGRRVLVTGLVDFDVGRVEVSDDGVGFDVARQPDGHFGILGMRERAGHIGAAMDLHSGNRGTTVTLTWGRR